MLASLYICSKLQYYLLIFLLYKIPRSIRQKGQGTTRLYILPNHAPLLVHNPSTNRPLHKDMATTVHFDTFSRGMTKKQSAIQLTLMRTYAQIVVSAIQFTSSIVSSLILYSLLWFQVPYSSHFPFYLDTGGVQASLCILIARIFHRLSPTGICTEELNPSRLKTDEEKSPSSFPSQLEFQH